MWPTLVELENAQVNTYGLFIVLAFSAAFLLVHFRALRIGVRPERLNAVYIAAAVGGLLGGRILYAIAVDWERTVTDPLSLFSFSGFAVYGGILGGILGVGLLAFFQGIRLWKLADLAGPAVVLGMGVGRIGCFFAGCCHGAAAPVGEHPVGLLPESFTGGQIWLSGTFPFLTTEVHGGVTRPELLHTPLYPTQVWDAVALLTLAAVLAWVWKRRRFDGQIAALTLIVQPPIRIFVETFRADHRGYFVTFPVSDRVAELLPGMTRAGSELEGAVAGLTTSQAIGLGMMLFGVMLYLLRRNAGVAEETPIEASDDAGLDEALLEEL
jgi:phosphatidylglycerol:prolipoprotein diacylglycerol transferase